jgi:hypothetical protein
VTDDEKNAEIVRRANETIEKAAAKYGGPAPPLTPEELDRSETEIHNMLRSGRPQDEPSEYRKMVAIAEANGAKAAPPDHPVYTEGPTITFVRLGRPKHKPETR